MDSPKPVPIEFPPPDSQATLLAMYLEGIPLVQIARALKVGVPMVIDFVRSPEVRECILQYEECLEVQTRLSALAARIPAMATLREVCATEGSPAERRRAASDLLRQSNAAAKPAQAKPSGRTPLRTSTPEALLPNPNIETPPEIPLPVQTVSPEELNVASPADSNPSAPIEIDEAKALFKAEAQMQEPPPAHAPDHASSTHTASWHAFARDEPDRPIPDLNADSAIEPRPASPHPAPTPAHIPSPYDLINPSQLSPTQISTPLPDAAPVAA